MNPPTPKDFIKELATLRRLDTSKTERQMFHDFCAMAYYAHSKKMAMFRGDTQLADEREDAYMKIVGTYRNKDVVRGYPKLMAIAMIGVDYGEDFLGSVAAELSALDQKNGQYFTPMNICMMIAQMTMPREFVLARIENRGYITISEPAAGGGAMLIAAKRNLEFTDFDPLQHMLVHATELNQLSYWMCYLQLTWSGIPALVINGNSLSLKTYDSEFTLPTIEFTKHHDTLFEHHPKSIELQQQEDTPNSESQQPAPVDSNTPTQLAMFDIDFC